MGSTPTLAAHRGLSSGCSVGSVPLQGSCLFTVLTQKVKVGAHNPQQLLADHQALQHSQPQLFKCKPDREHEGLKMAKPKAA